MKEKKITFASKIIAYAIKHKRPYPLGNNEAVEDDMGSDVRFDEANYVAISKSRFALEMDIHQAQVSRWLLAGLDDAALWDQDRERIVWWRAEVWLQRHRKEWLEAHEARRNKKMMRHLEAFLARHEGEQDVSMEVFAKDMMEIREGDPE